jgi:thiamine biosynthesis lipoprotein
MVTMMNRLLVGMLLTVLLFSVASCEQAAPAPAIAEYQTLEGRTMGTTYKVVYLDNLNRNFQKSIDSALVQLNLEVSTYIDTSTISRFNRHSEGYDLGINQALLETSGNDLPNSHFLRNLLQSFELFRETEGAFEPTIMPLVNYWGFGYTEKKPVLETDSSEVDSLLRMVGMQRLVLEGSVLHKEPGMQLDFSAIAKGYGVDLVAELLENRNVANYFVEIGGEVRARGLNSRGTVWQVGVSTPNPDASLDAFDLVVPLRDQALATSGNYRNYYEVQGRRYAHTINPRTGYPELSSLLSATVLAETCARADALATACMVLGADEAMTLIERLEGVEALLLVASEGEETLVRKSSGFEL